MVEPRSSSVSLFRSGLGCKCPRCGRGHLFSGYLIVADKCDLCGLNFQGQDAGDGPAVFIILILGFFVVGMAVLFETSIPFRSPVTVLVKGEHSDNSDPGSKQLNHSVCNGFLQC